MTERSFFLAEPEKPAEDRDRRMRAIKTATGDGYTVESALDEKGINAFTCKICEMIQTCAYGIADLKGGNENVLFELGLMVALGKPAVILAQRDVELGLVLPSDLRAIEVVPFTEYIDIVGPLKEIVLKLPPPDVPMSPIDYLEKLSPEAAQELREQLPQVEKEFTKGAEDANLDTMSATEDKKEVSGPLGDRLDTLAEKIEEYEETQSETREHNRGHRRVRK